MQRRNQYVQEWYQNELAYIMNLFDYWLACLHACFSCCCFVVVVVVVVVVVHLFSSC